MDELVKKCCEWKMIRAKNNFHQTKTKKDGFNSLCKNCMRNYNEQKRAKTNFCETQGREIDLKKMLFCNVRNNLPSIQISNVKKLNKTFNIQACSNTFLKRASFINYITK